MREAAETESHCGNVRMPTVSSSITGKNRDRDETNRHSKRQLSGDCTVLRVKHNVLSINY